MNQAKAATVAAAIIGAGYAATARQRPDGTWFVRACAPDFSVDVATAHNLAVNQVVVGMLAEIEYS